MDAIVIGRKIKILRRNPLVFIMLVGLALALGMIFPDAAPFSHATDNGGGDSSIAISPVGDLIIPVNTCADEEGTNMVCSGALDAAITVTTAGVAGYTLSMNTETANNALTSSSSAIIPSITSSVSTISNLPVNTWGYSKDNGSNYLPVPTSSSASASTLIAQTSTAGSSTSNLRFAAKTNISTASGAYKNTLVFSAVANQLTYTLNYDANTGTGAPAAQVATSSAGTYTFTLSDTAPTRTDYTFQGWCKSAETTSDTVCSGALYQPGAQGPEITYTAPELTLKAIWRRACSGVMTSGVCVDTMQGMNDAVKAAMVVGTTYQLEDIRDNETYYVAKLADGNVWMLDNLRLGGVSAINLTPLDTNITNDYTLPASSTTNFTASTGYTNAGVNADSKNVIGTSYGSGSGKIGNYYNYCAASAGTYCEGSTAGSLNASLDICPKGWRMPTGGSDGGEFQSLFAAYDSNVSSFLTAISTPYSGYYDDGGAYDQGVYGFFWSSTRYSGSAMYRLSVRAASINRTGTDERFYGESVRCVADSTPYMQDVNSWQSSLASVGQSMQVRDKRDGKKYWVSKLADGNIWMTQNLDFNINATTASYLNSTYSDLLDTWTPSSTYYTKTTATSSASSNDYYSWDLGSYYYNPSGNSAWNSCGIANITSYGDCTNFGFSTTKPTSDGKGKTLTNDEREHYQVGTLYQWCAATAGACASAGAGDTASGSICPKGWRLPYSGDNTTNQGFGYLLSNSAYNLVSSYDKNKITADPLYFVPGGYMNAGVLRSVGNNLLYWSSESSSGSGAYSLFTYSGGIFPSSADGRQYGFNIRCVAAIPDYTVTIVSNNTNYGTVSRSSVPAHNATSSIVWNGNFWIGTTKITANAKDNPPTGYSYIFADWDNDCNSRVTANCTVIANFARVANTYSIAYDLNGGTSGGDQPTSGIYDTGLTISKPTKPGCIFKGWTISGMDTSTHYYGASSSSYATSTASSLSGITSSWFKNLRATPGIVTFTAVWEQPYMQDVSAWGDQLAIGDQVQAIDRRDNKTYWVARLADNKVWMTSNLDLDLFSTVALTPENTDVTADWIPVHDTTTDLSDWVRSDTIPYSYDSGNTVDGNYYNWTAAVAMNDSSGKTSGTAASSICPKGWKLPVRETYGTLLAAEGIISDASSTSYLSGGFAKLTSSPLDFRLAGYIDDMGAMAAYNAYGIYWSAAIYVTMSAYYLYFHSSAIYPQYHYGRFYGYNVRCLAA